MRCQYFKEVKMKVRVTLTLILGMLCSLYIAPSLALAATCKLVVDHHYGSPYPVKKCPIPTTAEIATDDQESQTNDCVSQYNPDGDTFKIRIVTGTAYYVYAKYFYPNGSWTWNYVAYETGYYLAPSGGLVVGPSDVISDTIKTYCGQR
jgi:hypothetical protein